MTLFNENNKRYSFLKKGYFPGSIFFSRFGEYLKTIENKKCFIVASKTVYAKNNEEFQDFVSDNKKNIFFVSGETSEKDITECINKISLINDDNLFILAIGGGSVIDLAKAIKYQTNKELVVVPTTPSTGSEVTPFAVSIDENKRKKIIHSHKILPEVVVLDPLLLKTIPQKTLGYMIFDIFGHSIEGLFSKFSNPLSDIFAKESLQILLDNDTEEKGTYLSNMQIAGLLGGFAQGMASTGLCHAIAHYFGPRYDIPHSQVIAVFLPAVVDLNLNNSSVGDKLKGLKQDGKNIVTELKKIQTHFGIDGKTISVPEEFDMEDATINIEKDVCTLTNPFRPTREQITKLIENHITYKK